MKKAGMVEVEGEGWRRTQTISRGKYVIKRCAEGMSALLRTPRELPVAKADEQLYQEVFIRDATSQSGPSSSFLLVCLNQSISTYRRWGIISLARIWNGNA